MKALGSMSPKILLLSLLPIVPVNAQLRVTTADAMKNVVANPAPEYSQLAKTARVEGDVVVEVKIDEKGNVEEVNPLIGNSILASTVLRTVRTWKFKPFEADGKKTSAVTSLRFHFRI